MKQTKRTFALLLSICMMLSLMPVQVWAAGDTGTGAAAQPPEQIEAVTLTASAEVWPEGEEKPADLCITAANVYPLEYGSVYFEVSGGTPNTRMYFLYANTTYSFSFNADGTAGVRFYPDSAQHGVFTLPILICSGYDVERSDTVYETVTLTTYLADAEELPPMSVGEMNSTAKLFSVAAASVSANVYLPLGTVQSVSGCTLELIGHTDGQMYGRSVQTGSGLYSYTSTLSEKRYGSLFTLNSYDPYVSVQYISGTVYLGRKLTAEQDYDLRLVRGEDTLLTLENYAEATELPLVSLSSWSDLGSNVPGADTAYLRLGLTGGDPADYSVAVYRGNTLLGVSSACRTDSVSSSSGIYLNYAVPLSEPLTEGTQYRAVVQSDAPYAGTGTASFSVYTSAGNEKLEIVSHDDRYAAFVVSSTGCAPEKQLRFTLSMNGMFLAEQYAVPDGNGSFDVVFTDENGHALRYAEDSRYEMAVFTKSYGEWNERTSTSFTAPVSGQSTGSSQYCNFGSGSAGYAQVSMRWPPASFDNWQSFSLRLTSMVGITATVTPVSGRINQYSDGSSYYSFTCAVPQNLLDVFVTAELLYGGTPICYEDDANVLSGRNPVCISSAPNVYPVQSSMNGGPMAVSELHNVESLGGQDATLEFFTVGNHTTVPDFTLTATSAQNYSLDAITGHLNPTQKYNCVIKVGGTPLYTTYEPMYFWTEALRNTAGTACTVSVTQPEHGTLTLLDMDGNAVTGTVPAMHELFVEAVPDEGYQYKPGSVRVSGSPADGRVVLVSGNAVITAEFEPVYVPHYSVTLKNVSGGTASVDKPSAAAGETVTISGIPNEAGQVLDPRSIYAYYYDEDGMSSEIELTVNADGTCSFVMPEADVTVNNIRFRSPASVSLNISYSPYMLSAVEENTGLYLNGEKLESYDYVQEGTVLTVQAPAQIEDDGHIYIRSGVTVDYYDNNTNRPVEELPIELTDGVGQFTVPYAHSLRFYFRYAEWLPYNVYPYSSIILDFLTGDGDGAYYPGETVRFTVTPERGVRLTSDTVSYYAYGTGDEGELTPDENGVYTFTMPGSDVSLSMETTWLNSHTVSLPYYPGNMTVKFTDYPNITSRSFYEGETVRLSITCDEGYYLPASAMCFRAQYSYYPEYRYYAFTQDADGTYSLTMPDEAITFNGSAEMLQKLFVYTSDPNWGNYGYASMDSDEWYPGDTVRVLFVPSSPDYCLDGTPYLHGYSTGRDYDTVTQNQDGSWSFVMPPESCALCYAFKYAPTFTVFSCRDESGIVSGGEQLDLSVRYAAGDVVELCWGTADGMGTVWIVSLSAATADGQSVEIHERADGSRWFIMPEDNVFLTAELTNVHSAPGGTVTDNASLLAALGGEDGCAVLEPEGYVMLRCNVELENPLVLADGELVLDFWGYTLSYAGTDAAAVTVGAGADRVEFIGGGRATAYGGVTASGGPAITVETNACAQSGILLSEGCYQSAVCEALRLNATTANVTVVGTVPAMLIGGAESSYAMTATGSVPNLEFVNAVLWTPNGGSLSLPAGDTLAAHMPTFGMIPSAFTFSGSVSRGCIRNRSCFALSGWTGAALDADALRAAAYAYPLCITVPYTVSYDSDFENAEAHCTVDALPADVLPAGMLATVKMHGNLGWSLDGLHYYTEDAGTAGSGFPLEREGDTYSFVMPESSITLSACCTELAEDTDLLWENVFSAGQSVWYLSVKAGPSLAWNSAWRRFRLVSADGTLVTDQECFSSSELMNLGWPAGNYKLFVTVGDASQSAELGWTWVTFTDSIRWQSQYDEDRSDNSLTTGTRSYDLPVWFECAAPDLPKDLRACFVTADGAVAAESTDWEMTYYAPKSGTTDTQSDDSTTVRFHFSFPQALAEGNYFVRIFSGGEELPNSGQNPSTYTVVPYSYFGPGYPDAETGFFTGIAENVEPGTYVARGERYDGDTERHIECALNVLENGSYTVELRSDSFEGYMYLGVYRSAADNDLLAQIELRNFGVYRPSVQTDCLFMPDGGIRADAYINSEISRVDALVYEPGCTSLHFRCAEASGAGFVELSYMTPDYQYHRDTVPVEDLSSFTLPVTVDMMNTHISLYAYKDDGNYVGWLEFAVTDRPLLFYRDAGDTENGNLYLTPVGLTAGELAKLHLSFRTHGSEQELPFTVAADGRLAVPLAAFPDGKHFISAYIEAADTAAGRRDVTVGGNGVVTPEVQEQTGVTVSEAVLQDGVTTAEIRFTGAAPAEDAEMLIYSAARDEEREMTLEYSAVYLKSVNIGRTGYTIDSETLALPDGDYVLFFRCGGKSIGSAMFHVGMVYHTVYFCELSGIILDQYEVPDGGSLAALPAGPTESGRVFLGWGDRWDNLCSPDELSNVTEDVVLFACYATRSYEVIFTDWDGTELGRQTVTYRHQPSVSAMPELPTREGYTCTGWDLSALRLNGVTGNTVIMPNYVQNAYSVRLELMGGALPEGTETTVSVPRTADTTFYMPDAVPSREGYTFMGWYTDPDCEAEAVFYGDLTRDMTLYAGWEYAPCDICCDAWNIDVPDEAVPGTTVTALITAQSGRFLRALRLTCEESFREYLLSVTPVDSGTYKASFLMPHEAVTLEPVYAQVTGSLTLTFPNALPTALHIYCYQPSYDELYENVYANTLTLSDVPCGVYYLTAESACGYACAETVTVTAEGSSVEIDLPRAVYDVNFTVTSATDYPLPEDLGLDVYDADGKFAAWANVLHDHFKNEFDEYEDVWRGAFRGLPAGEYTVVARTSGRDYPISPETLTVFEGMNDVAFELTNGAPLIVEIAANDTLGSRYAYLTLEKEISDGVWETVDYGFCGSENGTQYLFQDAFFTQGNYRVTLENLTKSYYSQNVRFSSAPVLIEVGPGELTELGVRTTLSYSAPAGMAAFSGEGCFVEANRSSVNPGDDVELVIHYQGADGTAVAPVFRFGAHDGLTRTDDRSLTPPSAVSGSIHTSFRVDASASGVIGIPVYATVGGVETLFGTAMLTVNQVTLTAPAQAVWGESFTVYGEGPAGGVVSIRSTDGTLLAAAPVIGRFYSAQLTLNQTTELYAECGDIRSEAAAVSVAWEATRPEHVVYDWQESCVTGREAVYNTRLDTYTFCEYVDMELNGFDLPFGVAFTNGWNIRSVTFHLCGLDAAAGSEECGSFIFWKAVFPAGAWGGSGLKPITADIVLNNGETLHCTVAVVNLLIDPSGVVTDEDGNPLEGVTVVCQVWDEEQEAWVDFDGESSMQVNPQVTDASGRYGWFVPEGTYRILASKTGYQDYDSLQDANFSASGVSTIVIPPARTDIDFSMRTPEGTKYSVIRGSVENASVTASAATAAAGETVTLTVEADTGYIVTGVSVRTASGRPVTLNGYSFTMPRENVVLAVETELANKPKFGAVLSATQTGSGLALKADHASNPNAQFFVAFYDAQGRMIGMTICTMSADGTGMAAVPAEAGKACVTLLDALFIPLAEAYELTLK